MVVVNFDLSLTGCIIDDRAIFCCSEDTVDASRIALFAITAGNLTVIYFVDIAVAQTGDLNTVDVTDGKVAMQRCRGFKVTMSFQFNFTMLNKAEAGDQGKFVWSQFQRLSVAFKHQRQHHAIFILIMRRKLPCLNPGKTVCRFACRTKPGPADRYAATNRFAR